MTAMFTLACRTLSYRNGRCCKLRFGLQTLIRFGADYDREQKGENRNDHGRFTKQRVMKKAEPLVLAFRFRLNESCEHKHRDKK